MDLFPSLDRRKWLVAALRKWQFAMPCALLHKRSERRIEQTGILSSDMEKEENERQQVT
jgi:hypothetical protein